MYHTGYYGYGFRDWGGALVGTASSGAGCSTTTSTGVGYPGRTSTGVGYPGWTSSLVGCSETTSTGVGYPGWTSSAVSGSETTSTGVGYPGWTSTGIGYPGCTSSGVGCSATTSTGVVYPGWTSSGVGYPGWTSSLVGCSETTSTGVGYPGWTSTGVGYPVCTSSAVSGSKTTWTDVGCTKSTGAGATVPTSLGDTSRTDRLLGIVKDEDYQEVEEHQDEVENTIPLPEELTKMFLSRECKLCFVFFSSDATAYIHYEGKVHRKAVSLYMKDHFGLKGSLLKKRNRFEPVFCEVCKMTLTSRIVYETHFAGKTHSKNLRKIVFQATEPAMEDDVDFMFQPTAPPLPPKLNEFVCEICHISANTEHQLISHKEGTKHQRRLRRIERQKEEEYDEYYDEEEDYLNEEIGIHEVAGKGPVEHVEDPDMDQPLQFSSGACVYSRVHHTSETSSTEQATTSEDEEAERSKLWDYLDEMMQSGHAKTSDGELEVREKEREDNSGSDGKSDGRQETRLKMDNNVNKVNPGAAPVFHKYKSALDAQKGEMISMIIPPDRSRIVKPEPRKPLYLPPEIRRKVGVIEQPAESRNKTDSAGVTRTAGRRTSVDILERPWEPYYNPNVDFHRRKSPSPEDSTISRGYEKDGGTVGRNVDERNSSWDVKCRWYRGRLPREEQDSRIGSNGQYGGDRYQHEESTRRYHRSRNRSGTPEPGFRWGLGDVCQMATSSESTRTSSTARSSCAPSLSSRSSSRARSVRKSSKVRSSTDRRSGRSKKPRRSGKSRSPSRRSRGRSSRHRKSGSEDSSAKLGRKRKISIRDGTRSNERKIKKKSTGKMSKKMKTSSTEDED